MPCNDKRRYLPAKSRKDKPIKADGGKNAAADGYSIRHREPYERPAEAKFYQQDRSMSPGLKDEYGSPFDSYLMD